MSSHNHAHHHLPAEVGHLTEDATTQCPVMPGSTVVKADAEADGLVREHHGTRYWLCCDACGPLFDADPDRYATAR